jgi:hypothetical protein
MLYKNLAFVMKAALENDSSVRARPTLNLSEFRAKLDAT